MAHLHVPMAHLHVRMAHLHVPMAHLHVRMVHLHVRMAHLHVSMAHLHVPMARSRRFAIGALYFIIATPITNRRERKGIIHLHIPIIYISKKIIN